MKLFFQIIILIVVVLYVGALLQSLYFEPIRRTDKEINTLAAQMLLQQGIPDEVVLQKAIVNTAWGHENLYPPNKVKNLVTIIRDQDQYYWRGWKNQKLLHTSGITDVEGMYAYDLFVSEIADGFILLITNVSNARYMCMPYGKNYRTYIEVRQNDQGVVEWYTGTMIGDIDLLVPYFCRYKTRQPKNANISSTEPILSDEVLYKEPILKRLLKR